MGAGTAQAQGPPARSTLRPQPPQANAAPRPGGAQCSARTPIPRSCSQVQTQPGPWGAGAWRPLRLCPSLTLSSCQSRPLPRPARLTASESSDQAVQGPQEAGDGKCQDEIRAPCGLASVGEPRSAEPHCVWPPGAPQSPAWHPLWGQAVQGRGVGGPPSRLGEGRSRSPWKAELLFPCWVNICRNPRKWLAGAQGPPGAPGQVDGRPLRTHCPAALAPSAAWPSPVRGLPSWTATAALPGVKCNSPEIKPNYGISSLTPPGEAGPAGGRSVPDGARGPGTDGSPAALPPHSFTLRPDN